MIKVLPNLDEGIQIVGFLKEMENQTSQIKSGLDTEEKIHYMIYRADNNNEIIQGVTQSCY